MTCTDTERPASGGSLETGRSTACVTRVLAGARAKRLGDLRTKATSVIQSTIDRSRILGITSSRNARSKSGGDLIRKPPRIRSRGLFILVRLSAARVKFRIMTHHDVYSL